MGYLTVNSIGPWVYVIRIVHGVGLAALFSVFLTIVADVVPKSRRTEGIAILGVSGLLPLSLGGLLGDAVLARASTGERTLLVRLFLSKELIPLWAVSGTPRSSPLSHHWS